MTRSKARQEITWADFRELRTNLGRSNPSMRLAANLGWYAGLRVTEMTRLRWYHFQDLNSLTRRLNLTGDITKNHVPRTLPVALPLAKALLTHRQLQLDLNNTPPDDEHVLTHRRGPRPLTPRAIQKSFTISAKNLSLGRVTPHTLRHTFATNLLSVSSTRLVQLALGHKSITTTELYTHPTIEEIELAMARAFTQEA
jgi:integrase/recombinase XerC